MADAIEVRGSLTGADIMTAGEVAAMLGVPVSTVLHWGRTGLLPRIKFGRHVRFVRAHIEQALLEAETGAASSPPRSPPQAGAGT